MKAATIGLFCLTAALACVPLKADALNIRGQFPLHQGMYWNFSSPGMRGAHTWCVNGRFAHEGAGDVFMFVLDTGRFLAVRDEWDGIYLYGEYGPEGFGIPETPLLFYPSSLEFDKPVVSRAKVKHYSPGENVQETGVSERTKTFTLKGLEDMSFNGREYRNCSVIECVSVEDGVKTVETFWMAPSVGPLKWKRRKGNKETVLTLDSFGGNRFHRGSRYELSDYFPLTPEKRVYSQENGGQASVELRQRQVKADWEVYPYKEGSGDEYFIRMDERGLLLPLKFVPIAGLAVVFLPPEQPVLLLPRQLEIGRLCSTVSYYRTSRWPSVTPMLDFLPEMKIMSIPVGREDVVTPSVTYADCIKICLSSVSRAFAMQREKIRAGYIWLAKDTGIVKQHAISYANAYLDVTPDFVYDIQMWRLQSVERAQRAASLKTEKTAPQEKPGAEQMPSSGKPYAGELKWAGNSEAMVETTIKASPFFVRPVVKKQLIKDIRTRVGSDGTVTEGIVIESVTATTPEKFLEKMLKDLEKLRSR